jgi:two-component system cell cycle sensor histidine kinase/response regulator CckA
VFPMEFNAKWVHLDRDYIVSVVRDISGRKQAEKALQVSEERYRLFFANNPLSMWLYDLETFRFLAVNDAAVKNYGYSQEEFLAMTIKDIRFKGDVTAMLKSVEDDRGKVESSSEWRHLRKDGEIIQVEIFSRPLVFDGHESRLVLAIDITEKKLLERKFLEAQRMESIGMLAAGIAHDLNNVLAPIMFGVPMLRQSLSMPGDLKILETIGKCTERGAGLVRQILGFVHSTTGEFLPIQVSHVVNDIVSVIEETFPKSIQIERHIPDDLWIVKCNPTQIHQALLNLCINARDAMPQGGTLRVAMADRRLDEKEARSLPGARQGAWLVIEISDTGTGIAPEALAHVWDPFFTTKDPGKGSGLGLSSVRRIAALHGGFVTLDTQFGKGTTFRVFLPATEESAANMAAAPESAAPEGDDELILVAEDDTVVRENISTILSRHRYRILSVSDGVEAVEQFAAHSVEVALVVLDVDMPRMDGAALARILAQLRPDLRLLAISGMSYDNTNALQLESARKLTHSFLRKPFTAEVLLKAVHSLLHPSVKT